MGSNRKVAIGKLKCTTRLKNKTWTNPEIKNHKKRHEPTDLSTDTAP